MYEARPMAPDVRFDNSADIDADAMLGAIAQSPNAREVLAGAFLEFARWFAGWSPDPNKQPAKRSAHATPGTNAWRRKHFRGSGA